MANIENYDFRYTDECLLEFYKKNIERINFSTRTLGTHVIQNAYCLPLKSVFNLKHFVSGGICDINGKIFEECKIYPNRLVEGYEFNADEVFYDAREVIYAGACWPHWGHFILEQTSRLYYFLNEKNSHLPIIYFATEPLQGTYLEFFELLGIDTSRLIFVNKLTQFKKIIVPDVSMEVLKYYTDEYKQIFKKISSNVPYSETSPKKVFLTTTAFERSKTKDFGEIKEIEEMFAKSGYKIVSPEQLSLREQISLIKSCEKIVMISGTLPHNLLFADRPINAAIINKTSAVNPHQPLIDDVVGIYPINIDAHLSMFPAHIAYGPFFFHVSDNLIRYAKDNNISVISSDNKEKLEDFIKSYPARFYSARKFVLAINMNKFFHTYKYYLEKTNLPKSYKLYVHLINLIFYCGSNKVKRLFKTILSIKFPILQN